VLKLVSARRAGPLAGILALAVAVSTCAVNPVTGKRELSLVSEGQEIQMGQQYAQQVKQEMGVYPDSGIQRYVRTIGLRLAKASERPSIPWDFTVMDDPQVNAFALPGGPIFITRGILTHMNSEAELASVIGHEIGHVTARHSAQQITRQQLFQVGLVAGAIASEKVAQNLGLLSTGLGILSLKYGRDDESQADQLGFRYALNDGYDVRRMVDMFRILERVSGGSGRIPEWQSTHPDPGNRIAATEARLRRVQVPLDGKKVGRAEFLAAIDGMIFGDNPRQGYFKDGRFYHPDLAFTLDFPSGWQTVNQTSAVAGLSPEKDAQVQLTLAGKGDPGQTLQQFLGQEGIRPGQARSTTINGNPGAIAAFQAQTQEGNVLNGMVAMVSYGGVTYQLLGITANQPQAYSNTFQSFIQSFRRLTDQNALSVKPDRIDIVRVPRAMTLAEFNQQYPSTIPIERLALINGVADGNARLAAGESVKRVVNQ